MHHPTDRITHTTAFVTPVVDHWLKREIHNREGRTIVLKKTNGAVKRCQRHTEHMLTNGYIECQDLEL